MHAPDHGVREGNTSEIGSDEQSPSGVEITTILNGLHDVGEDELDGSDSQGIRDE
jgi:hypothetical protein